MPVTPEQRSKLRMLQSQVSNLDERLKEVVTGQHWGGARSYVRLYNSLLSEVKEILPELPLTDAGKAKRVLDTVARGDQVQYAKIQNVLDRDVLLELFPLCGQLRTWIRLHLP